MRIAIVSPSFAAPGAFPQLHERAMDRLRRLGHEPVEYPTTRQLGASASDRARDVMAAFADPSIEAVFATIGGTDQITVTPHIDTDVLRSNPKPFFGYSDNTNLCTLLASVGVPSVYGGSTQVHLAPGPEVDPHYILSIEAALEGRDYEFVRPGWYAEHGVDWNSPEALTEHPPRKQAPEWEFKGPKKIVRGRTWGGCLEVVNQIAVADRLPTPPEGGVLLLETSEECPPVWMQKGVVRALGERGMLEHVAGVVVALAQGESIDGASLDREEANAALEETLAHYCPQAVRVYNVPFGHTLPQQVMPFGGEVTIDAVGEKIIAHHTRFASKG